MKKIFSFVFFVLALASISYTYKYEHWPYNYHVANFLEQLSLWLLLVFMFSLVSFILDYKNYKIWSILTVLWIILSLFLSYKIGDGSGTIISTDGEMITWYLIGLYSIVSIFYFITQYLKKGPTTI